jgi:AcrR family transcriptional regulator
MVYITHNGENPGKLSAIIEIAQKRFGMFGLEKTTMKEIAADLNMSKGSLYYYFPDKEHLYRAVVEKEQAEFIKKVVAKIQLTDDPGEMLKEYVRTRLSFFKSLLNLGRLRFEAYRELKPIMGDAWRQFHDTEVELICKILSKGKEKNIFYISDLVEIAELFLDLLKGLGQMLIKRKDLFFIEQDDYSILIKKAGVFTDIFINGLMNPLYLKSST